MAENAGSSARQPPGSDSGTSDPKPAPRPVRVREHGLTELWAGGSDPVADVVFVHGLQGHPYKTWLFEGKVEEQVWVEHSKSRRKLGFSKQKAPHWQIIEVQKTVFWPGDLLLDDAPKTRIFTFGYDSHVSHGVRASKICPVTSVPLDITMSYNHLFEFPFIQLLLSHPSCFHRELTDGYLIVAIHIQNLLL